MTQNTNGAVGTGGTQALDVLNSRKIRFVIQGMFYAMMSGLLVAVQGNVSSIVQTYAPFIDLPTGVALGILAVICLSFCQELIAFIVLLIVNTIRGTGPREYIRLYGKACIVLVPCRMWRRPVWNLLPVDCDEHVWCDDYNGDCCYKPYHRSGSLKNFPEGEY